MKFRVISLCGLAAPYISLPRYCNTARGLSYRTVGVDDRKEAVMRSQRIKCIGVRENMVGEGGGVKKKGEKGWGGFGENL